MAVPSPSGALGGAAFSPACGQGGPGELAGTPRASVTAGAQPGPLWCGLRPGDNVIAIRAKADAQQGSAGPRVPQGAPTFLLDGSVNPPVLYPPLQGFRGEEGREKESVKHSPARQGLILNAQGLRKTCGAFLRFCEGREM